MALTCSSRDWLSDLNVNVSTFISFITRLSRLAKSPLLVDLDHTLMMTTRFLIHIMPKIVPWATFQNSGRDDLHKDIFTSIRAVGCVQKSQINIVVCILGCIDTPAVHAPHQQTTCIFAKHRTKPSHTKP